MTLFEIRDRRNGSVIYSGKFKSRRHCIASAIMLEVSLSNAYLSNDDLAFFGRAEAFFEKNYVAQPYKYPKGDYHVSLTGPDGNVIFDSITSSRDLCLALKPGTHLQFDAAAAFEVIDQRAEESRNMLLDDLMPAIDGELPSTT